MRNLLCWVVAFNVCDVWCMSEVDRRELLTGFYKVRDPSKLHKIEDFITLKWDRINDLLMKKYGASAALLMEDPCDGQDQPFGCACTASSQCALDEGVKCCYEGHCSYEHLPPLSPCK